MKLESKEGISVLMSVYQNEKASYFKEAIDSILSQTRLPDEIILMEDGPLPLELEQMVKDYERRYNILKVHRLKENVQLGRALSAGVKLCENELIARMDTDDIAVPQRLKVQAQFMREHPDIAVSGGWMEEFNDEGTYRYIKKMPEGATEVRKYGRYRCPVNHMTVMFRKSDVLEAGNYQHFPNLEDYHLWSRMMAKDKKFYNIPQVLVRARTNLSVYSRRGGYEYFKRYMKLRRMQKELGVVHGIEYIGSMIGTAGMTLVPDFLRGFLYRRILRRDR